MDKLLSLAMQLQATLLKIRRSLHAHPEVGTELPQTKAFVMEKLREFGYAPAEICESGIVAILQGKKPGKTLMLRADMDGLKIPENTNLTFAATNGCMHACGHDMHTAMLLGAAKLLKQQEDAIAGTIKFVFQPNEEGFGGAKAMLRAGVLENPQVAAAMALHVSSGVPSGLVLCGAGTTMAGCTFFRITITGIGCHGAMPNKGIDPINIAAHIHLALQAVIAREIDPTTPATLTIGRFSAGQSPNIIPENALLEGSIRTLDPEVGAYIYRRIQEIATQTAALFHGSAVVEEISSVPPLQNDPVFCAKIAQYVKELFTEKQVIEFQKGGMGSEDFAVYTHQLPCCYLLLGAGTAQENKDFGRPMHNEKVVFNEEILPLGCAIFAHCAKRWLEENISN